VSSATLFDKDEMLDILDAYPTHPDIIADTIYDNTRWSIVHELIFKRDDKCYRTYYRVGATEHQEERPWDYDDAVKCTEVKPVERTVTVYEAVDFE